MTSIVARRRLHNLLRTAAAGYVAKIVTGLAIFTNLSVARSALTPVEFGQWMFFFSLTSFLQFADLGVGNALQNKLTEYYAKGRGVIKIAVAGYVSGVIVGVLLLVIGLCIIMVLLILWKPSSGGNNGFDDILAPSITFLFLICLSIPASLHLKFKISQQKGYWNGVIQIISGLLSIPSVMLVAEKGYGTSAYIIATLGVQVVINAIYTIKWIKVCSNVRRLVYKELRRDELKAIFITGGSFLGLQLAAAFAFQSDSIVINIVLGPEVYGDFAVVQRIYLTIGMLIAAGSAGLWAAFGEALAKGDHRWARQALLKGLLIAGSVSAVVSLLVTINIDIILGLWLKDEVSVPMYLPIAFGAWVVIEAMTCVTSAFMNGAQRIAVQFYAALAMSIIAFGGKFILIEKIGVAGSVLSTIMAYLLISVPVQFIIVKDVLRQKGTST